MAHERRSGVAGLVWREEEACSLKHIYVSRISSLGERERRERKKRQFPFTLDPFSSM